MHYVKLMAHNGRAGQAADGTRTEKLQRKLPPGGFLDLPMETPFPVRKSLIEKSGIIGLPAFPGQDSLVNGEKSQAPGLCRKNRQPPKKVLFPFFDTGNDNHE
jgi:hypothetical protein